jgi:hypothetical protein
MAVSRVVLREKTLMEQSAAYRFRLSDYFRAGAWTLA